MRETHASKSLINKPLTGIDQSAIPVSNLAEQFCIDLFRGKDILYSVPQLIALGKHQTLPLLFNDYPQQTKPNSPTIGTPLCLLEQPSMAFKGKEDLIAWQAFLFNTDTSLYQVAAKNVEQASHLLREQAGILPALRLTFERDSVLVFYRRRWEEEIYNRFHEARKRFPEFFPCFGLKYSLVEGLQYSIHFKPLTKHAEFLTRNALLFPSHEEFKPIERLWSEDGQSELDIIFKNFPTQLALNPSKEPQARWRKLVLGLVNQVILTLSLHNRSHQCAER